MTRTARCPGSTLRGQAGAWVGAAPFRRLSSTLLALAFAMPGAHAAQRAEVCDLPLPADTGHTAAAIVRTACLEHKAWFQPFIDLDGHLASLTATEAERARLQDDTPAWQRVARYWRESGTLSSMSHVAGARSCLYPAAAREADNDCRAYLVDNPWSAAFVSWVMTRSSVPGFTGSARHVDYIARAWRDPERSPYVHADPFVGRAAPGDLLCYLREGDQALGPEGLRQALAGDRRRVPQRSHCDIVVAADVDGDRTLYLIGGNVFDAVTMRKLPLDAEGRLLAGEIGLPSGHGPGPEASAPEPAGGTGKAAGTRKAARASRTARATRADRTTSGPTPVAVAAEVATQASEHSGDAGSPASPAPAAADRAEDAGARLAGDPGVPTPPGDCRPGDPAACSFNRRDWVVLLRLKPQAQLGGFPTTPSAAGSTPPAETTTPPPPM